MARAYQSLADMERIRELDAKYRAEQAKTFVPEKVEYTPWLTIRIDRCTKGNIKGLFSVVHLITEQDGKHLRHPIEKVLAEGVDMHIVECTVRKAVDKRLNQRPK